MAEVLDNINGSAMTTLTTSAHIVDFVESPSFYHEDLQAKFFIQLEA